MAQHHGPKIVTDELVLCFDGTQGSKGGNKIIKPTAIDGCILWLDADDKESIVESSNLVSNWLDKSGEGNHAAQSTSSYQPTYASASVNGRGGISFDGLDNYMAINFANNVADGVANDVIIVFRALSTNAVQNGGSGANNTLYVYDGDDGSHRRLLKHGADSLETYAGADQDTGSDGNIDGLDVNIVVTRYSDSGAVWRNGRRIMGLVDNLSSSNGFRDMVIGADYAYARWSNIEIFELIVYNTTLSSVERQQVEWYLSNKWDIPLQLDYDTSSHRVPIDLTANAIENTANINYLAPAINAARGIFEGNDSGRYVEFATTDKVSDIGANNAFTFEWAAAMIAHDDSGTNYCLFNNENYQNDGFIMRYSGSSYGRPYIRINHASGATGTTNSTSTPNTPVGRSVAGEWAHWCFVFDGGNVTIYKNNVFSKSAADWEVPEIDATDTMQFLAQSSQGFQGECAFLRFYQKALTDTERAQNYNAMISRINAIPKIAAPTNVQLYLDAHRYRTYGSSTWWDMSINENHATVTNATQVGTTEVYPKYYDFSGDDDSMELASAISDSGDQTVMAWVLISSLDNDFFLGGASGTTENCKIGWLSSGTMFARWANGGSGNYWSANTLSTGQWYMLTYRRNSSNEIIVGQNGSPYLGRATEDGGAGSSGATTSTGTTSWQTIGRPKDSTQWVNGKIANILIYDKYLSDAEVVQNYNYFKHRFGK